MGQDTNATTGTSAELEAQDDAAKHDIEMLHDSVNKLEAQLAQETKDFREAWRLKEKAEAQLAEQTILFDAKYAAEVSSWGKRAIKAEAQLAKVRNEYLNHIKATKSPVMVLDAIGWILEDKT